MPQQAVPCPIPRRNKDRRESGAKCGCESLVPANKLVETRVQVAAVAELGAALAG